MQGKNTVLLVGGTGLIGKKLINLLRNDYKIILLTRDTKKAREHITGLLQYISWEDKSILQKAVEDSFAIINLSGAPIVGKRWSKKYKQLLIHSRLEPTKLLVFLIANAKKKPSVFINASAVGYYGTATSENIYTEDSPPGKDFLANLCVQWENEAEKAKGYGTRVVTIRSGIVLDKKEGALPRIVQPFHLGVGGPIGLHSFYFPWIHATDEARIILFVLQNNTINGAINAVAPEVITNNALAHTISDILHRVSFLPLPRFVLQLLFGEGAQVLTTGLKISSERIQKYGFTFSYPTINQALKNILL